MAAHFSKRASRVLAFLAVLIGILVVPVGTALAGPRADALMINEEHRVSDPITRVEITKLSYAAGHTPLVGAKFQLIEKATGTVIYEWTSDGSTVEISRELYYPPNAPHDQDHRVNINLDTRYLIHEVSAPRGYKTAPDVEFEITGWYDSSITVYNYAVDENGLQHAYLDGLYHITILDESKTEETVPVDEDAPKPRQTTEVEQPKEETETTPGLLESLAQTGDTGPFFAVVVATVGLCALALGIRTRRRAW